MLATEGVAGFTTRRLAAAASTSTPAVYELFGDKAGLLRELFYEGFRQLRRYYEAATGRPVTLQPLLLGDATDEVIVPSPSRPSPGRWT
jgi:AcrR family transcriptional regulator